MRRIILQDAQSRILTFEANLLSTVQAAQAPADTQVRRAIPLVNDHFLISNNSHGPTEATVGIKDDTLGLRQDMQMLKQACSLFANGTSHLHQYQLDRNISTVVDLWREWSEGLRTDSPSVMKLDSQFEATWRS
ncbi:hypothetical protein BCV71DRAFT_264794 [Rhizopus microsporus]|uniref:Transcription activator GCR1-like domain-containing protein n=1 Tax=Rhizopus microsporus TaxID=58291 RepID=A0A1X0RZU1_RHIZD|nr:hypothetical protein BCV71DRAFT_264794 [Rhizopus microsporus]